jgi:hypothetical protein
MLWALALPEGRTYTTFDTGFERLTRLESGAWGIDAFTGWVRPADAARPVGEIPGELVAPEHPELASQKVYQFVRRGNAPADNAGIVISYWDNDVLDRTKALMVALLAVGLFLVPKLASKGVPEPRVTTPVASIVLIAVGATFVTAADSGWIHFWQATFVAGVIGLAVSALLGAGKWAHAMRLRAGAAPSHTVYLPPRQGATETPATPPAPPSTDPDNKGKGDAKGSGKKEA